MARARGANTKAVFGFEATPGAIPAAGATWHGFPLVTHNLGEERPLLADDTLGQGREIQDPTQDVATNTGDVVVPIDVRNFGYWLKLFLGAPASVGTDAAGYTHTFTSGAGALPSMSLEFGQPDVPAFTTQYGARGDKLKVAMARSGKLSATCSLICQGETALDVTSDAGANPTAALPLLRFPQASGFVNYAGQPLGSLVGAEFTFSNELEAIETIKADGRIEDADVGQCMVTGSLTVLLKDTTLLAAAQANTANPLAFGWTVGGYSLTFNAARAFLPPVKRPITGPKGIQQQFNFQCSGAGGHILTAVLKNDFASYAA